MFRNRGENPIDIDGGNGFNVNFYPVYYIVYDKSLLIGEMVAVLLVLITLFGAYIFSYKGNFNDPIANVKSTFLNLQLVSILIPIIVSAIAVFIAKSKEKLVNCLYIIAILSFISLIIFAFVKIGFDNKYNNEKFLEYYNTYEQKTENSTEKKVNVGINGIQMLNDQEKYIEESVNSYNNFKMKTFLYLIINSIVIFLIWVLASRLKNIENRKKKIFKNDDILFDNEQNIKM
mgnify:CR=1 FL=1